MGDGPSSGDDGKITEVLAMVKRYEPGQLVATESKQLAPGSGINEEKQLAPVSGVNVTTQNKDPKRLKKNPLRKGEEKAFQKHYHPAPREEPKDTAVIGNITKLLPANTFLMFQTLAPLATNQGSCGQSEYLMTSIMLLVLGSACAMVCFTDTFQFNGKVYHGVVTRAGLWNPSFKGDPAFKDLRVYEHQLAQFYQDRKIYKLQKQDPNIKSKPVRPVEPVKPLGPWLSGPIYHSGTKQFALKFTDFLHAVVTVTAFLTFTLLTSPVTNCFYPNISTAIVKTLPILVGFVASAIFGFSPPARNGLAHPLPPGKMAVSTTPGKPASINPNGKNGDATTTSGAQPPPPPPPGGSDSKGFSTFMQQALNQAEQKLSNANLPPGVDAIVEMGEGVLHDIGSRAMTTATSSAPAPKDAAAEDLMPQVNTFSAYEENPQYQQDTAVNSAQPSTQLSGSRQTLSSVGSEAATMGAHALAAGQARAQEGFQLPSSPSPYLADQLLRQQSFLGSQGFINQNLIQANTIARDGSALYGQGLQSFHNMQNQLLQQGSAVEQGLNAQVQTMEQPAISVAHGLASLFSQGSHLLSEVPSFMAHGGNGHLGATVAREVGNLLVQGADHGVVGVTDEIRRQKDVAEQDLITRFQNSIQPLTQGVRALEQQGSQNLKGAQDELLRSKAALQQDLNTQLQALRQPSTSLAQGLNQVQAQLSRPQAALNYQYQNLYQPASSVAIDIPSLAQQGSRAFNDVRSQLQRQESATAQGPVAQFQQTVAQIRTDQSPSGSKSPVQQLSVAFAQEVGPSGLLNKASQSVSSFADSTGDEVARTGTYVQGLKEGVDNVVTSAQIAKLSTAAEIKEMSSSSSVPELRESSNQLAERVLRGVLASTSQTAQAAVRE